MRDAQGAIPDREKQIINDILRWIENVSLHIQQRVLSQYPRSISQKVTSIYCLKPGRKNGLHELRCTVFIIWGTK